MLEAGCNLFVLQKLYQESLPWRIIHSIINISRFNFGFWLSILTYSSLGPPCEGRPLSARQKREPVPDWPVAANPSRIATCTLLRVHTLCHHANVIRITRDFISLALRPSAQGL
jgi:hypothetical protein